MPLRIRGAQIVEGAELKPLIMDDFGLAPIPKEYQPGKRYGVVFRAAAWNEPKLQAKRNPPGATKHQAGYLSPQTTGTLYPC
jgi:hypothetical protein